MEQVKKFLEQNQEAVANNIPIKYRIESEDVFTVNMQKGYKDAMKGRCKPINQAFADIQKRFS